MLRLQGSRRGEKREEEYKGINAMKRLKQLISYKLRTGRQADRQTDRQAGRHRGRQTVAIQNYLSTLVYINIHGQR